VNYATTPNADILRSHFSTLLELYNQKV
jgi:hypothetical protein